MARPANTYRGFRRNEALRQKPRTTWKGVPCQHEMRCGTMRVRLKDKSWKTVDVIHNGWPLASFGRFQQEEAQF